MSLSEESLAPFPIEQWAITAETYMAGTRARAYVLTSSQVLPVEDRFEAFARYALPIFRARGLWLVVEDRGGTSFLIACLDKEPRKQDLDRAFFGVWAEQAGPPDTYPVRDEN